MTAAATAIVITVFIAASFFRLNALIAATLLMVILGNLESAQRNAASTNPSISRQRRSISAALQGTRRAVTLTQRLLAFSRRQPLSPKPLDVSKFIVGEIEFLQRSLGETVEVQGVGGAGVWQVEADVDQLEAALLNLAVNARDAMQCLKAASSRLKPATPSSTRNTVTPIPK